MSFKTHFEYLWPKNANGLSWMTGSRAQTISSTIWHMLSAKGSSNLLSLPASRTACTGDQRTQDMLTVSELSAGKIYRNLSATSIFKLGTNWKMSLSRWMCKQTDTSRTWNDFLMKRNWLKQEEKTQSSCCMIPMKWHPRKGKTLKTIKGAPVAKSLRTESQGIYRWSIGSFLGW